MKWNILVGSLVLGLGLSTQSFGADLLDRMLGMNYNGCSDNASCCETTCCDPCEVSCGCEDPCAGTCAPKKCRKTPLLDLLRGCRARRAAATPVAARIRAKSAVAVKIPAIRFAVAKIPAIRFAVAKIPVPVAVHRKSAASARCWTC